jgi:D-2-hydroxyacid dehydrogenase (NADP+)
MSRQPLRKEIKATRVAPILRHPGLPRCPSRTNDVTTDVLIVGRDSDVFGEHLTPTFPKLRFHCAHNSAEALALAPPCEILVIRTDEIFAGLVAAMPRLRLIQALTTGVDHIMALPNLPSNVMITAARGFHGPQMSELAFLFMLAFARKFPAVLENQKNRIWDRREQRLLVGKTVLVVGVGRIAEELAQRCKLFGMRVVGVSTRATAPHFDVLYPRAQIAKAAALADFLILLAPYTKENHHLVDAATIDAMKPDGVLINIARGGVLDEEALRRALLEGRIAGAGLDVFQTEPLPPESPLWDTPNVIITSHVGGVSETYAEQVMPILIDNLRAFMDGAPERMSYIVKSA